jgi:hypothetical protein
MKVKNVHLLPGTAKSVSANKQQALDAAAKRKSDEWRDRRGATFRAWWYACACDVPPGNAYEQSDEQRESWREKAEAARSVLVSLGLVP